MTAHDDPQETPAAARARRRAEVPPPGSVEQEAALLVDLLSQRGWGAPAGMPSGHGSGARGEGAGRGDRTPGESGSSDAGADDALHGETGSPGTGSSHECTCGGRTPAACAVCPVCQLIAFVQQVNPDTIDKVADFVGFAATALRDLATAQRERQAGTDREPGEPGPDGESS